MTTETTHNPKPEFDLTYLIDQRRAYEEEGMWEFPLRVEVREEEDIFTIFVFDKKNGMFSHRVITRWSKNAVPSDDGHSMELLESDDWTRRNSTLMETRVFVAALNSVSTVEDISRSAKDDVEARDQHIKGLENAIDKLHATLKLTRREMLVLNGTVEQLSKHGIAWSEQNRGFQVDAVLGGVSISFTTSENQEPRPLPIRSVHVAKTPAQAVTSDVTSDVANGTITAAIRKQVEAMSQQPEALLPMFDKIMSNFMLPSSADGKYKRFAAVDFMCMLNWFFGLQEGGRVRMTPESSDVLNHEYCDLNLLATLVKMLAKY